MKAPQLVVVIVVAVVSSLITVAALEQLRDAAPARSRSELDERATLAAVSAREQASDLVSPESRADASEARPGAASDDYEERVAELERRLAELERARTRQPASADVPEERDSSQQDELRQLVLDWVAEDRDERARAQQQQAEELERKNLEFSAKAQAHQLAELHGLEPWQEEKFAELFLEMGKRAAEIEASIDPAVDDPQAVEARWIEFDEWIDQRERELTQELDPVLYTKIYGDD